MESGRCACQESEPSTIDLLRKATAELLETCYTAILLFGNYYQVEPPYI
jgi:hypothetical protein